MVVISVYTYGVKIIKKFRWESGFLGGGGGFHGTPPLCTNGSAGYLMQLSVNQYSRTVWHLKSLQQFASGLECFVSFLQVLSVDNFELVHSVLVLRCSSSPVFIEIKIVDLQPLGVIGGRTGGGGGGWPSTFQTGGHGPDWGGHGPSTFFIILLSKFPGFIFKSKETC